MSAADGTGTPPPGPAQQLIADLDAVLERGAGRLTDADQETLAQLRARVAERLALGDGLTVVALAGGTGVGKSALLNALVGTQVVQEGVRRPTTDHPVAVAPAMDAPTAALLDWLGVADRRVVPGCGTEGLVLVDLPDHDSVAEGHRTTSDRLSARVDALVVVVDPLKYARADLHDGPLAALRQHAEVVLVALNRVDELASGAVGVVAEDLADRLAADGLEEVGLYPTSAITGQGVGSLRDRLLELADSRRAVLTRLTGDAAAAAADARTSLPELPEAPVAVSELVDAVLAATDGNRAVVAHTVGWRAAARRGLRSPLARLARSPLVVARHAGRELGLTGLRPRSEAATVPERGEEALAGALARELALADTTGLSHEALDRIVRRAAAEAAPHAAEVVRDTARRPPRRRWWWPVLSTARGVAETVALTGLVWSVLLGVAGWLGLPEPPTPQVTEELTWPAALLLGGLAVRVLLGACSRWAVRVGARRVARAVEGELRGRLTEVVEEHLLAPYRRELAAYRQLHTVLRRLAGA